MITFEVLFITISHYYFFENVRLSRRLDELTHMTNSNFFLTACSQILSKPESYIRCVHSGRANETKIAKLNEKQENAARARLSSYINDKRPFIFATPQTIERDLQMDDKGQFSKMVRLIVFDEAHRATGNYSYVNVMKMIYKHNRAMRVVGLSATPGNSDVQCQTIVNNLLISKVDYYHEGHEKLAPYTKNKKIVDQYLTIPPNIASLSGELENFCDTWNCHTFKSTFSVELKNGPQSVRVACQAAQINSGKMAAGYSKARYWSQVIKPGWIMFYLAMFYKYLRQYGVLTAFEVIIGR